MFLLQRGGILQIGETLYIKVSGSQQAYLFQGLAG